MDEVRDLNRFLGFIPLAPILTMICIGLVGIIKFKSIPAYGEYPDPHTLGLMWLHAIAAIPFFISFFTIPASILLTIHLLLNKSPFRQSDKLSLMSLFFSVTVFFLLKYQSPDFFLWIMD